MSSSSSSSYNCVKGRVNSTSGTGLEDPSPAYENKHKSDLACILSGIRMDKRRKNQDVKHPFAF